MSGKPNNFNRDLAIIQAGLTGIPAGGGLGGTFPDPTSTGGSLDSITDGTTTITPVTDLTVPPHSLSGTTPNATLGYVTDTYGGQEVVNTVAATGSTETLPATANTHDLTLTADCTLTLPTLTSGRACAITVILRQDGTGSRLVTWPGSVAWVTGTAPVLKTAINAVDVVTLFTLDGGTTWGGAAVGVGSSLTVQDEGSPLATAATTLDFVGAGVVASGTGATKTITVAGVTTAGLAALGVVGQILISNTPSTPLIFADLLQTEAQDDLVYADL